jgi:transposase InsO family protein
MQIIYRTHNSGAGGHPERMKTPELVSKSYYWPKITHDIQNYVKFCHLYKRVKAFRSASPGYLRFLPVPFQAWQNISVDYITPLPIYERNGLKYHHVAVVVCYFTKIRHFILTSLTTAELADAFVARIYALHETPNTIISDRGTQFISEFWKKLFARFSIILKHSSAYHPKTNGQTEKINAILKQYLKAYMNFRQNNWVDWLPLAKFALNNAVSETTGFSSFFANYGFNPKLGFEPRPSCSSDKILQQKREFIKAHNIADRIDRILTQMKALAEDTNRRYKNQANRSKTNALRYKIND